MYQLFVDGLPCGTFETANEAAIVGNQVAPCGATIDIELVCDDAAIRARANLQYLGRIE